MAAACQGHVIWLHEDERDGQRAYHMADTIQNCEEIRPRPYLSSYALVLDHTVYLISFPSQSSETLCFLRQFRLMSNFLLPDSWKITKGN